MEKFENIVILAAGRSTRFWPLKDKNLFIFCGESLIYYQFKKLSPYAERIIIIANQENAYFLRKLFASYSKVKIVIQKGEGQASALLSLANKIGGEVLLVNNIDIFNEKIILPQIIKERNNHQLILTAKEMKEYFPGGYLKLKKKQVVELIEKPGPEKRPSNMVRLVVDYIANFQDFINILKKVKNPMRDGAFEEGLNLYLKKTPSTFINYQNYWYFLKYPWHVLSLKHFFLSGIKKYTGKDVLIDKTAKIKGDVYLEDGVKIHEYSKIVGPCYIGKNTIVGNYCLVRESMIGDDCLIGGYSELTRSYLGNRVYLHRNYLGDCVVENNVLFGAEAVCANFRFDEKEIYSVVNGVIIGSQRNKLGVVIGSNVKIGVNASLMPGVKIAAGSMVMPNSLVLKDVKSEVGY
jgi:bifunctional UDP-N-acetylglucosamine pyrophosphorylase/glucosamine-1-phosphate N-acetyltransferase